MTERVGGGLHADDREAPRSPDEAESAESSSGVAAGESLSVLHVVPYFPPDRVGGVGEVAAHLHEALLQRGHRSLVVTAGTPRSDAHILRVARSPVRFIAACPRYVRLTHRADVVHVHHGEAVALLGAMKLFGVGTPVLLTLHASPEGIRRSLRSFELEGRRIEGDGGFLRRTLGMKVRHLLDRWAIGLADRLSFISRSTARDFLPPQCVEDARVIYNGLPEPPKPDETSGPPPEPVELLYVGVYNVRKRVQALPFVLARIRERAPGVRLRAIGFRPEDHPEFLRLARSLDVEDAFVFEGILRSEELPPYYRASRVLLVPSAYEGLPMVVMEAFQNGLPCVATRVSGLPEIVEDGENGYLVDVDRPDQMAAAALKVLSDPALGRRMGAAGKAVVQRKFGVERQVEEYLDLYRRIRARSDGAET